MGRRAEAVGLQGEEVGSGKVGNHRGRGSGGELDMMTTRGRYCPTITLEFKGVFRTSSGLRSLPHHTLTPSLF